MVSTPRKQGRAQKLASAEAQTPAVRTRFSAAGFFLPLLLLPSGAAALIYQVAWVRLLGLSMGSTSASIATVLAAFFLGMAAGSWLGGRWTRGDRRDLRLFIAVEVVVALSAAALLPILLGLDQVVALAGGLGTSLAFKFVATIVLLALPTICMGATFPLLASFLLRRGPQVAPGLSKLYALNTAGAVLGAGICGFVLIPSIGLGGAISVGVALDLAVAASTWLILRRLPAREAAQTVPAEPAAVEPTPASLQNTPETPIALPLRAYAMAVLVITGATSIAAQVGWAKYLALFTGTTVYGFTTVLIIFLTGIALGSWGARSLLRRIGAPGLWLLAGLAATGLAMHFARVGLSMLPALQTSIHGMDWVGPAGALAIKGAVTALLLLPPTLLFGALFPLSLSIWSGGNAVGPRVGSAYAANTIASVAGSILAGFVFIPLFGTDLLLLGLATLLLLAPLAAWPLWDAPKPKQWVAAGSLGVLALLCVFLPRLDLAAMIESTGNQGWMEQPSPEYLYIEEGKAGIISAAVYDRQFVIFQNDGLRESFIDLFDSENRPYAESLLGYVPYFVHPDPRSAFVVGFGGGATLHALAQTGLEQIRVVELEPAVVRAVASVQGQIPALSDPRVQLTYNDARNTLVVESTTYDLILSQPSHPWRSGAGNLFTREFFQIVRNRLNPDGVFGQWVNLFNMDASTLRTIFQAFFGVFPHGFVFVVGETNDMLLFGSLAELKFDFPVIAERIAPRVIDEMLWRHRVLEPRLLLQHFALSRDEALRAAGDAPPNRDLRLYSEFRLALIGELPQEEDPYYFIQQFQTFDVLDMLETETQAEDLLYYALHMNARGLYHRVQLAYSVLSSIAPDVAARLQAQTPIPLR